jgi:hypothetical protein
MAYECGTVVLMNTPLRKVIAVAVDAGVLYLSFVDLSLHCLLSPAAAAAAAVHS